jgi:ABC-type glycerol-3-phosphate transport system permease component
MKAISARGAHRYALLALYGLAVILPLLFLVRLSLKTYPQIIQSPLSLGGAWDIGNYAQAWDSANLGTLLLNTAVVACVSTFLMMACASLAAFVLARHEFRGSQALYLVIMVGMALPIQLMAVPLFVLMRQLGLINTLPSLILVYTATSLPFSVFLLVNSMRGIPRELEEAALLDGCGPARTFLHIVLPLSRPTLTTVGVFSFIGAWSGFFLPLVLIQNPDRSMVATGIVSFVGEYQTQWNLLLPALVIVSLPTIVIFIVASRQFVRNMNAGALKM